MIEMLGDKQSMKASASLLSRPVLSDIDVLSRPIRTHMVLSHQGCTRLPPRVDAGEKKAGVKYPQEDLDIKRQLLKD